MTQATQGASQKVIETYDSLMGGTLTPANVGTPLTTTVPRAYSTLVQNDHGSAGEVYVGGPLVQSIRLNAGESITIATDPSRIYVRDPAASATVRWLAVL